MGGRKGQTTHGGCSDRALLISTMIKQFVLYIPSLGREDSYCPDGGGRFKFPHLGVGGEVVQ